MLISLVWHVFAAFEVVLALLIARQANCLSSCRYCPYYHSCDCHAISRSLTNAKVTNMQDMQTQAATDM